LIAVSTVRAVADEATGIDHFTSEIHRRHRITDGERNKLVLVSHKEGAGVDEHGADAIGSKRRKGSCDLGIGSGGQVDDPHPDCAGCIVNVGDCGFGAWSRGKQGTQERGRGYQFMEHPELLR
jgi:hypothetical protein